MKIKAWVYLEGINEMKNITQKKIMGELKKQALHPTNIVLFFSHYRENESSQELPHCQGRYL